MFGTVILLVTMLVIFCRVIWVVLCLAISVIVNILKAFFKLAFLFLVAIIILLTFSAVTYAQDNKKLPIPRFASIKSTEVNARTGPSIKAPIEWVFTKKGEPVEITAEYEQWRQIRDIKGEGGWVHLSVLSGKRSVVVISKNITNLFKEPDIKSTIIAKLAPSVRCQLSKCKDAWCKLDCKSIQGWLPRKLLWGIYADEKI